MLANDGRGLMRQPRQPGFVAGANCVLLSLARDTHRSSGAMVRISVLNDTLKVRALRCTSKTHFTRCYLRLSIARRFRQYGNLHFFRVFLLINPWTPLLLQAMYNAEKRGKRQVLVRPVSKVVIKFLQVMQKHGECPPKLFSPCALPALVPRSRQADFRETVVTLCTSPIFPP